MPAPPPPSIRRIHMRATVLLAVTLDTKAEAARFLVEELAALGLSTLVADCGALGTPPHPGDISRHEVARRGGRELADLVATSDKGLVMATMARGLCGCVAELHAAGRIQGIIALGGGQGTAMATAAMQLLPLGFPKVMVTTLAAGDLRRFIGTSDIAVFPSVADILGLNEILRTTLGNAARALAGMAEAGAARSPAPAGGPPPAAPLIGATAFGTTTAGLMAMHRHLTAAGLEVAFFHANGVGGRAMEGLARQGRCRALLDWTTHEIVDQVAGGAFRAGEDRMDVLAERPIPCVVSTGALDYLVHGALEDLPPAWRGRNVIVHNRNITLVRTTAEEMAAAARFLAAKLNRALGPATVMIPRGGFSEPSAPGRPFHDPAADARFVETLRGALSPGVRVVEMEAHINDDSFVRRGAEELLVLLADAGAAGGLRP